MSSPNDPKTTFDLVWARADDTGVWMTVADQPDGTAPDGGPHNPRSGSEVTALAAQVRRLDDRVQLLHAEQ